jgi:lipopolysaccharide/colanic/teichoic acid biosynthesis glycosyltransferase
MRSRAIRISSQVEQSKIPIIRTDDLKSCLRTLGTPYVVFALGDLSDPNKRMLIKTVATSHMFYHVIPEFRELPVLDADISPFLNHELAMLTFRNNLRRRTFRWLKRLIDLVVALPGVIVAAPVIAVSAVLIFVASPGNPFYAQRREGLFGKDIFVWKLRTMRQGADRLLNEYLQQNPAAKLEWETKFKLTNDPRILPIVGKLFRRMSIDELPQLWNVIKGDLSLVGPRPFPHYHLNSFSKDFRELRREVKPGITGLWQICVRSEGDLADQEYFDSYYIRNWSMWLDFYILWRTIDAVVLNEGAR